MNQNQQNAEHHQTLATFDHLDPAEALCNHLIVHGIPARVRDERNLQRYWFLCHSRAGIHVEVPVPAFEDEPQH